MRLPALILLTSSMAFAQARGTPASVTSLAPSPGAVGGPLVIHGVPSSVTSLGPEGFTPFQGIPARGTVDFGRGRDGRFGRGSFDGRGHGRGGFPVPVYIYGGGYPYYYDPSLDYDYQQQAQQPPDQQLQQQQQQQQQPQQLQIIVRDKRDEAQQAAENEAAVAEASQPKNSNLSDPPHDPAIFIFKDGSRKELGNFAIMAGMLYDLSDNKVHKYPLNTIDRDATLAANASAGREINLP
jgi:hypothetical protein